MTLDLTYDDALASAVEWVREAEILQRGEADPQKVQAYAQLSRAWSAIADQLVMHTDLEHDEEEPGERPTLKAVPDDDHQDDEDELEHRCDECGRVFDSPQGLGGHRRVHNPNVVTVHQGECSVDGCDRDVSSRGWCSAHYERWRSKGDVFAHVPIGAHGDSRPLEERQTRPGGDGDRVNVDESQGEGDTEAGSTETVTPSTNGSAAPGDIVAIVEQLDPPPVTQDGGCLLIVACTGCGAWTEQPLDATPLAGHESGWEDAAVLVDQAMHEQLHDGCPGERVTARLEPKIGAGEDVRSSWDVIRKQTVSVV